MLTLLRNIAKFNIYGINFNVTHINLELNIMRISPIIFSLTENKNLKKKEVSPNKDIKKEITDFPSNYGKTNIAFCGREKSSKKVQIPPIALEEFISHYDKLKKEQNVVFPYFEPYRESVNRILTYLCSGEPCLVVYSDQMDSKELLLNDIRQSTDKGSSTSRLFGIKKGIPIITLNCADYVDRNPAIDYMEDDIINNVGDKKAIIVADEADTLFNSFNRPDDFLKSSLFKKYPTIFLLVESYTRSSKDDIAILSTKFLSSEDRFSLYPDLNYSDDEASRLASKQSLLQRNSVGLPSITSKDACKYLSNPIVQRFILAQNNNLRFNKEAIIGAISLADAMLYYKPNHTGAGYQGYIINEGATALDLAISLLKNAAVNAINLHSKTVRMNNLINIFPFSAEEMLTEFNNEIDEKNNKKNVVENEEKEDERVSSSVNVDEDADVSSSSNYSIIRNPKTKFSDIGGMFNVKKQLKEEFLDIFKNDKIKNSQKPNGILLYGPPGCGKTLLAKAIAGEAGVPFISTAGSSFIEIYVGTGPKRVRELYDAAREEAAKHPSKTAIVFIDEVDAAAGDRQHSGTDEDTKTVDALLHEMDGTKNKSDNDVKIITVIATNNKNMLDCAITRSGRIDVKCYIDDPRYSEKARREIINIHVKDLPFESDEQKEKIIENLANSTAGMSGADLAEVIKKAYRLSLGTGRENVVTQNDINEAKMRVQAGIKTDIESNEYEKRQTIAREAGHAVNSMMLEKLFENESYKHKMPARVLDFISNSARGGVLGSTYFKPSGENKTVSKESCFADVIMLYGSYAVETQLFDTHTSNVEKDMEEAASIIEKAIIDYDFGSQKRFVSLKSQNMRYLYADEIKSDIAQFSTTGMKIAQKMIQFAKPFIAEYTDSIISKGENKEVTAEEFKSMFNSWIESNGKKEEYEKLCQTLKTEITDFCKEKEEEKAKLGF
ncbi:AAA family ATPase [bacterium]|nr:AAA family ATPase [bacterium]